MSHKSKDPGGRKGASRAARRAASAGKYKLETLPEIPSSDVDTKPPMLLESSGTAHNPGPSSRDSERLTPASDKGSSSSLVKSNSEQLPVKENESTQRPRSRTASPWRGRGRGGSSIFARSTNPRLHMGRQGPASGLGAGQDSATSPVRGSARGDTAPNSAGLISERSGADVTGYASGHRRRGHTLDLEQMATRRLSPKNGTESNGAGTDTSAYEGRNMLSAASSHFHISTENATLSSHYQLQTSPNPPPPGHPTRLAKHDSASSSNTVATLEIEESPKPGQPSDRLTVLPQGQLSKMLYREVPRDGGEGSASRPFSPDTSTSAMVKNSSTAGAPPQSAGIVGRTKRGGSGGETRFGDYKGALVRQQTQSVFGNRPRNIAGEPASAVHETFDQSTSMSFSGPVEIPGGPSRMESDPLTQKRSSQSGKYGLRTGRSSEETGDPAPSGALRRMSSKDVLGSGHSQLQRQQQQQQQQQQQASGTWLYTPPGERPDMDGTGHRLQIHQPTPRFAKIPALPLHADSVGEYQQPARPGEPTGYGVMAHRRDSTTVDRSHSSDHQHYIGAMQPVSRGSATSAAQYGASGELDDRRRSANHDDGLLDPRSTDSGGLGLHGMDADPQYVAPWLSAPSDDHKELLKFTTNGRWNAIAAAPNGEPTCAIAGHDGLFLRKMTADSPAQPQPLATNRRWILALDFKDVIWRPSEFVITGSNDGTVNVWDPTRAGDPAVRKYTKCSRPVTRLTHKPGDPNVIFSAFTDGSLFGWDMRDHSSRPFLHSSMTQAIKDIDCNPQDSNALAVITEDGRVTVSDMRNWKQSSPLQFLAHLAFKGQCISWHPNGRFIATGGHDSFKIWDINSPTIKKYAPSPYYSARTGASVHRIQWRPGHETQFAWCTLVDDSRLHVWDMGNLNHSLLYHDKHSTPITGFTWFDENTAWSVSRDLIVQCDMQCDAVVTGNLVAKTVADFSPNTRICVATGSFEPRKHSTTLQQLPGSKELEPPEPKPEDQDPLGSAPAIANGHSIAADDSIRIEDFQLDLPESFVDEHLLDSSMAINFKAIRYLARNYRYDPNQLKECCEVNTRAAIAVGHADIAKFWQFLSAAFGDLLPLKSKRKSRAPPRPPPRIEQTNPELSLPDQQVPESSNTGEDAASATTSRTSSGMFPSKSVTDILPRGESSDDEPHTKHPGLAPPNQYGRHSTNASPARVRQNHSATSLAAGCDTSERTHLAKPGYASGTVRLERNFMSLSHSDLQQVTAAPNKSRIPSPLSRPAAHSLSSPSCNYVSEPATPAHRFGHSVFPSLTTNPGLMSEATQRQTRHIGFAKDVPPQQPKEPPVVQKTGRRFFLHDESVVAEPRSVEPPAPRPRRPTFAFSGSPKPSVPADETRLHISTPRHASKADLKLIIDSCLYYAENGDVQTALTAALLMRNFIRLENWPVVRNWYSDYIDQLDRYQEYAAATDIILSSPFDDIQDQIAINSDIMVSCSHCGSKVEPDRIEGLARCSECNNLANSCVVCESPVRGRFIWCKGCGHGGHAVHMWDWFREMEQEQCPAGCGHACTPDLPASMG